MDMLKQKLSLRNQQISDMKSQLQDVQSETMNISSQLTQMTAVLAKLEAKFKEKDAELKSELSIKEKAMNKLLELEFSADGHKEVNEPEEKKDAPPACIEFYTKNVQSKPMFKKLPEFPESPEPSSPPTMNDKEMDDELDILGLSDILKKYS